MRTTMSKQDFKYDYKLPTAFFTMPRNPSFWFRLRRRLASTVFHRLSGHRHYFRIVAGSGRNV